MAYLDRKRLIQAEDADAPDTTLGLEIPNYLNPASPAYRYRKGPSIQPHQTVAPAPAPAPAPRRPDVQYNQAGKPMIWRKGVTPDPAITRTRERLLSTPTFVGRFRDRPPKEPRGLPPREDTVSQPEEAAPEVPTTLWDAGREFFWEDMSDAEQGERLDLLRKRPRDMHRSATEFDSLRNLMEETPGETRGTEEAMDAIVSPRLPRAHMRNRPPTYWPGSTNPLEFSNDWDPREAAVHPDRADNRRDRLVTSRGAPPRLIAAMDNMFAEHTGEDNPFAGPEASKRIRK